MHWYFLGTVLFFILQGVLSQVVLRNQEKKCIVRLFVVLQSIIDEDSVQRVSGLIP